MIWSNPYKYVERQGMKYDSFSRNHTIPYSAIAVQELNLCYHYPHIFWNTACLTLDSGSIQVEGNTDKAKQTEYEKIAKAIATIQQAGVRVMPPDINKASFEFRPDLDNNSILFSLKGIYTIGDDVVEAIIQNRPYFDFDDFYNKNVYTGSVIKNTHVIQLIKSGAFDTIEPDRVGLMTRYLKSIANLKTSLNMQNMSGIEQAGLVPLQFQTEYFIYRHRVKMYQQKPYKTIRNTKPNVKKKIDDRLYLIKGRMADFFTQHYSQDCIIEWKSNGSIVVSRKMVDKEYSKLITPLKDFISSDTKLLEQYNQYLFQLEWDKYALGGISKWEMDSLSYYYHEHELAHINYEQYNLVSYKSLSPQAPIVGYNEWQGRKFPRYVLSRIAGTVLGKNNTDHSITLLTPEGSIVTVKFHGGAFSHYNKQIKANGKIIERSWFTRGNKLMVVGYRREDQFIPTTYKNSVYQHTVTKILDIDANGIATTQSERYYVE